jgi:hypothetical protein
MQRRRAATPATSCELQHPSAPAAVAPPTSICGRRESLSSTPVSIRSSALLTFAMAKAAACALRATVLQMPFSFVWCCLSSASMNSISRSHRAGKRAVPACELGAPLVVAHAEAAEAAASSRGRAARSKSPYASKDHQGSAVVGRAARPGDASPP